MPELIPDLRAQREARGWTVPELARLSVTSDATIRNLENGGGCTPEAKERILAALAEQFPAAVIEAAEKVVTSGWVTVPSAVTTTILKPEADDASDL